MIRHLLLIVRNPFPAFGAQHKLAKFKEIHQPAGFQKEQIVVNIAPVTVGVATFLVMAAPDAPRRHIRAISGSCFARLSELKTLYQFVNGGGGHRFFSTITVAIASKASVLARE